MAVGVERRAPASSQADLAWTVCHHGMAVVATTKFTPLASHGNALLSAQDTQLREPLTDAAGSEAIRDDSDSANEMVYMYSQRFCPTPLMLLGPQALTTLTIN